MLERLEIEIFRASIIAVEADAIVNPANSYGTMGGGVARVIRDKGGVLIEKEAMDKAPILVGSALATSAGMLPYKAVIHAPTMEEPVMPSSTEKVAQAVRASLLVGDNLGFKSLALPGMGTGVGALDFELSAEAMLTELFNFHPKSLQRIKLVDINQSMFEAWLRLFKSLRKA